MHPAAKLSEGEQLGLTHAVKPDGGEMIRRRGAAQQEKP